MIKRKIALLTAILILLCGGMMSCKRANSSTRRERSSAAGASSEDNSEGNDTSSADIFGGLFEESESNYKPGDYLSEPEKLITDKEIYIYASNPEGDKLEVGVKSAGDSKLIYIKTAPEDEGVIEYSPDEVTAYIRISADEDFESYTMEDEQLFEVLSHFGFFLDEIEEMTGDEFKFKKCEDETTDSYGKVYVYEVYTAHENDDNADMDGRAKVWVDKRTGIFVKFFTIDGQEIFAVDSVKTGKINFPDYK